EFARFDSLVTSGPTIESYRGLPSSQLGTLAIQSWELTESSTGGFVFRVIESAAGIGAGTAVSAGRAVAAHSRRFFLPSSAGESWPGRARGAVSCARCRGLFCSCLAGMQERFAAISLAFLKEKR
ncbi:MAG: hypothetical protein ABFS30_16360, partial [Pseudomonadota bacterium]